MPSYVYSQLKPDEIRLVTLIPGKFGDPIHIAISHERLVAKNKPYRYKVFSQKHRDSLPVGWEVHETSDGRTIYFYDDPNGDSLKSSWTHPDPDSGYEDNNVWSDSISVDSIAIIPRYEALSYTWGSSEIQKVAFVDDSSAISPPSHGPLGMLVIRQNLATALQFLRYPHRPRKLWIDAIWYVIASPFKARNFSIAHGQGTFGKRIF